MSKTAAGRACTNLATRNSSYATAPARTNTFSGGPVSNWAPGTPGTPPPTTTISVSDSAPPPGTYEVRLWIPDPDLPAGYPMAKITYAVKLATKRNSANVFDPCTGENNLCVSITVQ